MNHVIGRVLIIEDDRGNRESLRRILKLDGYEVDVAESWSAAFQRDNWSEYFAILLDRKLPDGSADEWLPKVRHAAPEAGLIVITAFVDLEGAITAIRHGADDYLIKPIDGDDVRGRLRRFVELRDTKIALRTTEEELRAVLETAPDAIVTYDNDGRIHRTNPAASKLFGYETEEYSSLKIDDLLSGMDGSGISSKNHSKTLSDTSHDAVGKRRDGSFFPVDVAVNPMGDGHLFTGIIRDMSHRRELQREVLESAEEERRRIGGDLHDALGQHMTGITYLAETLRSQISESDPDAARLADRIAELLKETVEQTRRLVRGLYPVDPRPDGLRDALTSLTQRLSKDFRVDAEFDCPDGFVFNDSNAANHLFRIAQEASSNAMRHGRSPRVTIRIVQDDHWIHLTIADEGTGFDIAAPPPAGLGLRLMRYRAGLAGGELTIDSQPDSGTTIICSIPHSDTVAA